MFTCLILLFMNFSPFSLFDRDHCFFFCYFIKFWMIGDYNVTLRFWFGGKFKEVGDAIYYGGEWIGLLM